MAVNFLYNEASKKALVRLQLKGDEGELGFATKIYIPEKEDVFLLTSPSIFPDDIDAHLDEIEVHRWKAKSKKKIPAKVNNIKIHKEAVVSTVEYKGDKERSLQCEILTEKKIKQLKTLSAYVFDKHEKIIELQFENQGGSYKLTDVSKKSFDAKRAKGAPVIFEEQTHTVLGLPRFAHTVVGVLSINSNGDLYPVLFKPGFLGDETVDDQGSAAVGHSPLTKILWENLFSVNSPVNWEAMEDLPISNVAADTSGKKFEAPHSMGIEKECSMETENGNATISTTLKLDSKANDQEMDTFDIDLDYKDLPKPCIACYVRKPCLLTWSQDVADKKMEEKDIFDISQSPTNSALDICTSSMKRNSQNNLVPTSLFQRKSDSLKSHMNFKPTAKLFNQNMKRKESILKNNTNKNQTIDLNAGCISESSEGKNHKDANNISDMTTMNKVIDLTNDSQGKTDNKERNRRSLDFPSTKEQMLYKKNNYVYRLILK